MQSSDKKKSVVKKIINEKSEFEVKKKEVKSEKREVKSESEIKKRLIKSDKYPCFNKLTLNEQNKMVKLVIKVSKALEDKNIVETIKLVTNNKSLINKSKCIT